MLFGDKGSVGVGQLVAEIKRYVELQKAYARLELTEKMSMVMSALILIIVLTVLGMVALLCLSFTLAECLSDLCGKPVVGWGVTTLLMVVIMTVVYLCRRRLIISPTVAFLSSIFLKDDNHMSP